jgi:hypothetical protein
MRQQQCCQMVYFQTKNPNLGEYWKVLQDVDIFEVILSILRLNHIFYFVVNWHTFSRLGML